MVSRATDPEILLALFAAAYNGNLGVVKSLVKEKGVPVDVVDSAKGSTALHWACFGGNLEVVEWLVKVGGAKVTQKNNDDRTPLFFACEHCHKPVVAFLISLEGVDVNAKDGPSGHAPLHRACLSGQTRDQPGAKELISWLLTSAGADPELKDKRGWRPGEADLAIEAPVLKPSPHADEIRIMLENTRGGGSSGASHGTAASLPETSRRTAPGATRASESVEKPAAAAKPISAPAPAPAPDRSSTKPSAVSSLLADIDGSDTSSGQSAAIRAAHLSRRPLSPGSSVIPTTAPVPATMSRSASPPKKTIGRLPTPGVSTAPLGGSAAPSDTVLKPRLAGVPPRVTGNSPVTASDSPAAHVTSATISPDKPSATTVAGRSHPSYSHGSPRKGTGSSWMARSSIAQRYQPGPTTSPPSTTTNSHSATPKPSLIASRYEQSVTTTGGGASPAAGPPPSSGSAAARYQRSVLSTASGPQGAAANVGPSASPGKNESAGRGSGAPPFRSATSFHLSAANATSSGTESAEAEIAALNGPKASALAAAYEMKARNRQHAPAPRRPDPTQAASSLSKRTPSLSISVSNSPTVSTASDVASRPGDGGSGSGSGSSSGSAGSTGVKAGNRGGGRGDPMRPPLPSGAHHPSQMTPEELAGAGSVMKKKQVYVEAAQKSSQASPKDSFTTSASKPKKTKDPPSFMEKVVSMFSISPQSSRESSPASRSPSRSPSRSRSRSPHIPATGKNGNDQPRLGFFHSNLSFKQDSREKE